MFACLFRSSWPRSAFSRRSFNSCASTRSRSLRSRSPSTATCWRKSFLFGEFKLFKYIVSYYNCDYYNIRQLLSHFLRFIFNKNLEIVTRNRGTYFYVLRKLTILTQLYYNHNCNTKRTSRTIKRVSSTLKIPQNKNYTSKLNPGNSSV